MTFLKDNSIKYTIDIFVQSSNANSGPPIGTVLGNLGVNAVKFCKDFNDFTKSLPYYFILKVRIIIFDNRNFAFFVRLPAVSFILNLLRFDKSILVKHYDRMHTRVISCVNFNDLLLLCRLKFNLFDIHSSILMLLSTCKSSNIYISI